MADDIKTSQVQAQIEGSEGDRLKITQVEGQVEGSEGDQLKTTQVLAQVEYVAGTSGPTMAQLMRHGKWFGDGVKKPFEWAK